MARDNPRRSHKEIDVNQVLDYLSRAFDRASDPFGPRSKAIRDSNPRTAGPPTGSQLYEFQIEFCYIIHSIECGPRYMRPKAIQAANDLINVMGETEVVKT